MNGTCLSSVELRSWYAKRWDGTRRIGKFSIVVEHVATRCVIHFSNQCFMSSKMSQLEDEPELEFSRL